MKKIFAFTFLGFFLVLLSSLTLKKDPAVLNISGTWEETWGVRGTESEIPYHDQYVIRHKKETIKMTCPKESKFSFDHIHLTDNNFTFQLTNAVDPDDPYVMAYNLKVNDQATFMYGTVLTNKGVETRIELRKVGK